MALAVLSYAAAAAGPMCLEPGMDKVLLKADLSSEIIALCLCNSTLSAGAGQVGRKRLSWAGAAGFNLSVDFPGRTGGKEEELLLCSSHLPGKLQQTFSWPTALPWCWGAAAGYRWGRELEHAGWLW